MEELSFCAKRHAEEMLEDLNREHAVTNRINDSKSNGKKQVGALGEKKL